MGDLGLKINILEGEGSGSTSVGHLGVVVYTKEMRYYVVPRKA